MMISKLLQNMLIYCISGSIFASTLMVPLALVDYQLRKEYITEVLCINKAKKENLCQGKCYLMKRLDQAQKTSGESGKVLQERLQLSFFNQVINELSFDNPGVLIDPEKLAQPQSSHISSLVQDIFHPPRAI